MQCFIIHLSNVIGEDRIKNYLFDKSFDYSNALPCTKVDHVIFLDALVYAQWLNYKSDNLTYQRDLRRMIHNRCTTAVVGACSIGGWLLQHLSSGVSLLVRQTTNAFARAGSREGW